MSARVNPRNLTSHYVHWRSSSRALRLRNNKTIPVGEWNNSGNRSSDCWWRHRIIIHTHKQSRNTKWQCSRPKGYCETATVQSQNIFYEAIGNQNGMTFVRRSFMSPKSVHMETVVRWRTLEDRTIECPKNYLLTYRLSPRLVYLSLSLVLSLSFHFSPPPF